MSQTQRLIQIKEIIEQQGFTTINDLAERLNVSTMTIRRDLAKMVERNEVRLLRGGAELVEKFLAERTINEKSVLNLDAKKAIAKLVAPLIPEGSVIYLGTGSTVALLSDYLTQHFLRITTNSLTAFSRIANAHPDYEVTLSGGRLRPKSGVLIGGVTDTILERLNFDLAIVSADGVTTAAISDIIVEEGRAQSLALKNAKERWVIADHSKLDQAAYFPFFELKAMQRLFTDRVTSDQLRRYQGVINVNTVGGE
ncbi:DeoR/GlpR transcriptional regulator [Lactobacillus sp. CC-MHH1034]|uniref:DeoR/GlpR family DNA-binding transcription regulator n=1 Tax=Agrilactobacillus fermenti TaxID=2586909 RepID=UPI001E460017|nr:DeoR/GlpR family DNA-binding transcription regulator [Agrilactobacillus fermenti]MCD2257298.1 DeoR/GlpR transcriptional regulator [Agrilactobacillus fermenti]